MREKEISKILLVLAACFVLNVECGFSMSVSYCGDNIVAGPESCDTGKKIGCLYCFPDIGYTCTGTRTLPSDCQIRCGDSVKGGDEQCDNGNQPGCQNCI